MKTHNDQEVYLHINNYKTWYLSTIIIRHEFIGCTDYRSGMVNSKSFVGKVLL